jgi:hypothetical protein
LLFVVQNSCDGNMIRIVVMARAAHGGRPQVLKAVLIQNQNPFAPGHTRL